MLWYFLKLMSVKKPPEGYIAQEAGLGAGLTSRKDGRRVPSASMTEQESEERWDQLFASPQSPALLKKMAAEALADDRAGRTKAFVIDEL